MDLALIIADRITGYDPPAIAVLIGLVVIIALVLALIPIIDRVEQGIVRKVRRLPKGTELVRIDGILVPRDGHIARAAFGEDVTR